MPDISVNNISFHQYLQLGLHKVDHGSRRHVYNSSFENTISLTWKPFFQFCLFISNLKGSCMWNVDVCLAGFWFMFRSEMLLILSMKEANRNPLNTPTTTAFVALIGSYNMKHETPLEVFPTFVVYLNVLPGIRLAGGSLLTINKWFFDLKCAEIYPKVLKILCK